MPPTTKTRPSARVTADAPTRGPSSRPVRDHFPVAGSQTSLLSRKRTLCAESSIGRLQRPRVRRRGQALAGLDRAEFMRPDFVHAFCDGSKTYVLEQDTLPRSHHAPRRSRGRGRHASPRRPVPPAESANSRSSPTSSKPDHRSLLELLPLVAAPQALSQRVSKSKPTTSTSSMPTTTTFVAFRASRRFPARAIARGTRRGRGATAILEGPALGRSDGLDPASGVEGDGVAAMEVGDGVGSTGLPHPAMNRHKRIPRAMSPRRRAQVFMSPFIVM